ncbi:DUF1428 family protein [Roseibium hamelinense]|uniref:DUF1428 family protein n=1 Tax=Roseibium hamelinense TaxID=150831 RepID=UPI00244DB365|nr:DUF1428 family protein [Roseibium hamelinense]
MEPGETVVFSWIVWPDKQTADAAMARMPEDSRWETVMPDADQVFSMKRMIFGGFEPLLETSRVDSAFLRDICLAKSIPQGLSLCGWQSSKGL